MWILFKKRVVATLIVLLTQANLCRAEELVPFVEIASNQDCGVNCLVIACRMFEIPVDKNQMRVLSKLTFEGTSLFNLKEAALAKGISAKIVRWNSDQLARWPHLAVAHFENHFVLVAGHQEKSKESQAGPAFKIIDPPQMPYLLDTTEFNKQWDGYCLLLSQQPIRTWLFPNSMQAGLYATALLGLTLTAYGIRKAKWTIKKDKK